MPRDLIAYPEIVRDEVSQSLSAAADYIEAHGFCGDRPWDTAGRVCFVGAYHKLYPTLGRRSMLWMQANDRLKRAMNHVCPVDWATENPSAKGAAVAYLRAAAKL